MKISFIVPAYNEQLVIERCLWSIVSEVNRFTEQGSWMFPINYSPLVDYEIIVVDNNSSDHTVFLVEEYFKKYPVRVITCNDGQGVTHARQAGYKEAKYNIQSYIDADNALPFGWLDYVNSELEYGNPNVVALSGSLKYYGDGKFERKGSEYFYKVTKVLHTVFPTIQGGNFVVRKEALDKIGGHSTNIEFWGEDTDLAKRLSSIGKIKLIPEMWAYSSSRRFEEQGKANTLFHYALNYFSIHLFNKPLTKKYHNYRSQD